MLARSALALVCLLRFATAQSIPFDDRPATEGEWGFRPADGVVVETDPPALTWRPQPHARGYDVEIARDPSMTRVERTIDAGRWNVHCAAATLGAGTFAWRVRARLPDGRHSAWSAVRTFTVPDHATPFPMPPRAELLARIPTGHPRLFVRPEDHGRLLDAADGTLAAERDALVAQCERLLAKPPSLDEPPQYPPGTVRGSEPWRELWWGNRTRTIAVLESAATLAFTAWLVDEPRFADEAKRRLLTAATWDPHGATGYRYNDEAGMPYAYHFARTYSFLHDRLSDAERATCIAVLTARGREMYAHLAPDHLWKPYNSHSNRAWHFLGEVGIALHGDVADADDWVDFAMHVFGAVYPVWSDDDGGWHEGLAYWRSYLDRFTWWADVMRTALGVDAYRKPFFSRVGDFALYVQPPGTRGGGFGDLCGRLTSDGNAAMLGLFARQAGNPYWQWYRDAHPTVRDPGGYIAFLRSAGAVVEATPPTDLPTAKHFRGTGVAVLNTDLRSASDNVEVLFKSSPFGSQSHGYEAQNAFLLYAYGERLLIRSGRRDTYGSAHHSQWMWSTRSTNTITFDGAGQRAHSSAALGRITAFVTTPELDLVAGDATAAYGGRLARCERTIVFAKPDLLVVFDRLRAPKPGTFTSWLHAENAFELPPDGPVTLTVGNASCAIRFLAPTDLRIQQTDRFDPPPLPRIELVEHHLTVQNPTPRDQLEIVTLLEVGRAGTQPRADAQCTLDAGVYRVTARRGETTLQLELPIDGPVRGVVRDATGAVRAAVAERE